MTEKKIYGLPSYDMGDWVRGEDGLTGGFIENLKTGFRVYIHYPNQRFDNDNTKYVVSDGDFSMGFTLAGDLAMYHVEYPSEETPKVFIDRIGGRYMTRAGLEAKGYVKLADDVRFQSIKQQELFLAVLIEAVPRIPATLNYAFRRNGGFGYQVEFTEKLTLEIKNGKFVS